MKLQINLLINILSLTRCTLDQNRYLYNLRLIYGTLAQKKKKLKNQNQSRQISSLNYCLVRVTGKYL